MEEAQAIAVKKRDRSAVIASIWDELSDDETPRKKKKKDKKQKKQKKKKKGVKLCPCVFSSSASTSHINKNIIKSSTK